MSVFHTKGNSKMGYDMDALFERLHQELAAMTPQPPHTPSDRFYGAIPQEAPEAVQSHENESSRAVDNDAIGIAMLRPLTFDRRVGWKPGDGGEGWE